MQTADPGATDVAGKDGRFSLDRRAETLLESNDNELALPLSLRITTTCLVTDRINDIKPLGGNCWLLNFEDLIAVFIRIECFEEFSFIHGECGPVPQ